MPPSGLVIVIASEPGVAAVTESVMLVEVTPVTVSPVPLVWPTVRPDTKPVPATLTVMVWPATTLLGVALVTTGGGSTVNDIVLLVPPSGL